MIRLALYGAIVLSLLIGSIYVVAQSQVPEKGSTAREAKESSRAGSTGSLEERYDHWDPWFDFWGPSDPFYEIERMHRRMEQMLHSQFGAHRPGFRGGMFVEPRIDMDETEKELIIRCDLPGLEKDKIELTLNDDVIVIRGTRDLVQEENTEEKGVRTYRSERSLGAFYRTIPLPMGVDSKNATASYENGVLTIRLPKVVQEEEKPVKIQVT